MNAFFYKAYGAPSTYTFGTRPKPVISKPNHVVIKVHAASLNPIDYRQSCGDMKVAMSEQYVYPFCVLSTFFRSPPRLLLLLVIHAVFRGTRLTRRII